jgi:hypothetical protein
MPEQQPIDDLENTPAGRTLLLTQSMRGLQSAVELLTHRMEERDKQIDGHGAEPGIVTRLALTEQKLKIVWAILGAVGLASLAGVWELIASFAHIK